MPGARYRHLKGKNGVEEFVDGPEFVVPEQV